ncbi:DUF2752 domain-containing protein [Konateibacter massiliensis]|uniref:DUF2752 domain-containing protein n=1 Tax=Konateibacter massiliensis TaxID=2002841 RepID=UPI000C150257|nr:DUF2752 domain-containing protein [Konateibacter massiliensis]
MNTDDNKFLYQIGWAILAVSVLILVLLPFSPINYRLFLLPCPIYTLTGIYCPGCGGTRSVHALLHGSFLSSFRYNPIVLYCGAIYAWYMISNTIEYVSKHKIKIGMKYRDIYLWIGLGILLAFFVLRNFLLLVLGIDLANF